MPSETLDKPNRVNRPFTLQRGKLTFTTGDAAMVQRLKVDKGKERPSKLFLLSAATLDADAEFIGTLESVLLLSVERPQQWEVVMIQKAAKPHRSH